jgi:hypothetical protein
MIGGEVPGVVQAICQTKTLTKNNGKCFAQQSQSKRKNGRSETCRLIQT